MLQEAEARLGVTTKGCIMQRRVSVLVSVVHIGLMEHEQLHCIMRQRTHQHCISQVLVKGFPVSTESASPLELELLSRLLLW